MPGGFDSYLFRQASTGSSWVLFVVGMGTTAAVESTIRVRLHGVVYLQVQRERVVQVELARAEFHPDSAVQSLDWSRNGFVKSFICSLALLYSAKRMLSL